MKKEIKPTLLDFAILGLIQDQPLSGYGIRKVFEETAMGNYSNSPGTIYPAIKRLEKFELVEKAAQKDTGKTAFQITKMGLSELKKWLTRPIEKKEVEKKLDELLLRFAFMENLVSKQQKIQFLHALQDLLKNYVQELQGYYSKESDQMPLHARLAFQHGIETNKTTLKWCKKTILVVT